MVSLMEREREHIVYYKFAFIIRNNTHFEATKYSYFLVRNYNNN